MRWRWQGHDQVATFEGLDLLLERKVLGVGDVGRGVVGAGVVGCHSVVAEPGLISVMDAGGDDQPVVAQEPVGHVHPFVLAVNAGDLGVDELVTRPRSGAQLVVHQKVGGDDVHQPFVAHRAGEEHRVALQHNHLQFRGHQAQLARGRYAAPAASGNHHPASLAGHEFGGGAHHRCGTSDEGSCSTRTDGFEDKTTI